MNGRRLRQGQSIAVFGLNHFEETLELELTDEDQLPVPSRKWARRTIVQISHCGCAHALNASTCVVRILGPDPREEMDAGLSLCCPCHRARQAIHEAFVTLGIRFARRAEVPDEHHSSDNAPN